MPLQLCPTTPPVQGFLHPPSHPSHISHSPAGKFAIVYRAQRKSDDELVALKKINIDVMDKKNREKTLKEVRLIQVRSGGAKVGGEGGVPKRRITLRFQ